MRERRLNIIVAVGTLLGVGAMTLMGHLSFNFVLLAPFIAVVCVLLLLVMVVLGVFPVRRRIAFTPLAILLAGMALTCVGMVRGMYWRFDRVEREFAPLIASLEAYRAEKGTYPETVEELVPTRIATLPTCDLQGGTSEPPSHRDSGYHRYSDGKYIITCYTVVFWKYSYDSKEKYWYGWD
ncbi:hypothetical protein LZ198_31720 [Myxococcus sp. K15C18031901]|uniref:hypothetical protein n=1 Tax=Myxococcus dinghuensis TaxID=2906761 RepID=UPI0020A7F693|nr:hypothetical protein [Myxococcus dinghuensis]MCP3103462.1 hypothetical protein [Myxococcus dinghuensis]